MKLDDVLRSLFGDAYGTTIEGDVLAGKGRLPGGTKVQLLGYANHAELGVDEALNLAGRVLDIAGTEDGTPIMFLVDTSSQRMSRRDELLGLNEYLAHLNKSLLIAEQAGHRTIALLYGASAAGAFIATALACGTLVALPGATPAVMDLPSMARITKLPLEVLQQKAETTAVFAPGLDNLAKMGAIAEIWDPASPLGGQLEALLAKPAAPDARVDLGRKRGGRMQAGLIIREVMSLAHAHG